MLKDVYKEIIKNVYYKIADGSIIINKNGLTYANLFSNNFIVIKEDEVIYIKG